ncbi:MAG: hypothetical protein Q7S66_00930 [bacterium]|nr:hypothetical protein [bacterium]
MISGQYKLSSPTGNVPAGLSSFDRLATAQSLLSGASGARLPVKRFPLRYTDAHRRPAGRLLVGRHDLCVADSYATHSDKHSHTEQQDSVPPVLAVRHHNG